MAKSKETAFELDPATVGGNDAHPFVLGGFPGLWQVGVPVHSEALGLTVTRMRELVAELGLPLLEVQVEEGTAARSFPVPPNHIPATPGASAPLDAVIPEPPADEPAEEAEEPIA